MDELVGLFLRRRSDVSLEEQIVRFFRDGILSRRFEKGEKLPSSRAVASELGVSRNTAKAALEQLQAEGYVVTARGSGTRVATDLPEGAFVVVNRSRSGTSDPSMPPLSERGKRIGKTPVSVPRRFNDLRAFRAWLPAFDKFPLNTWAKIAARCWRNASSSHLRYGGPQGLRQLRRAIAAHLKQSRGIECDPEQVIITAGSQHALFITAQVLADADDTILVENPGYLGARAAISAAGVRISYLNVDAEGVKISEASKYRGVRALYVTPSHQYPLGVTMTLPRRLEVANWAQESGAWIIEDDYDTEFRYSGRPVPALFALDGGRRTIYVGSFSKILAPSLRMGYLVLPPHLVDAFLRSRSVIDRGTPSVDQAILATFIEEGSFSRHLREMRMLYASRQETLIESVRMHCRGGLDVEQSPLGMHLAAWCGDGVSSEALATEGEALGLDLVPLSAFHHGASPHNGILLGYTAISERKIREGATLLGKVIERTRRRK